MRTPLRRLVVLWADQLAGHWVEDVIVETTDLPPPNVEAYHLRNLIPHISSLIKDGIWVRHPYNRGECWSGPAQRYITLGSYTSSDGIHIVKSFKQRYPDLKTAFFIRWTQKYMRGELFDFSASTDNIVKKGTPDERLLSDYVMPWMKENEGWGFVHVHLDDHDRTASNKGTQVFVPNPHSPYEDKHHHLTEYLDPNVGRVVEFLKDEGWWPQTFLIFCSDHGYHLGCDAKSEHFEPEDGPSRSPNLCWNHAPPYDCHVWDFRAKEPLEKLSQCCRRITMIISGGALDKKFRGKEIETAEIIDIPATIADMCSLPYRCEGSSLLKKRGRCANATRCE